MRVLLVANTLPPNDLSGVGEQVLQLAAGLRGLGHEVEILGRGGAGARGPKALFPLAIVAPGLRAVRRFAPDVVQVHESDGGLFALALAALRGTFRRAPRLFALLQVSYCEERRAVRPLVVDGAVVGRPGAVERRFRWTKAPLQILLGRLTVRAADRVLAPSAATAGELRRDYGAADVAVLPNATGGVEIPTAASEPASDEAPGYLLFVGRLRIRKGVEVLLAALAALRAAGRAPRLLIAGDGEHAAALREAARRFGVEPSVRFLGRQSAGEVRSLLARAAALVVPSTYEGMPLVVLEAMAAGKPVVASAVSGIPEVVVDGTTGWLVPAEDVTELAGALDALLARPAEGARRGEAGRERLARLYRFEAVARQWTAIAGDRVAAEEDA